MSSLSLIAATAACGSSDTAELGAFVVSRNDEGTRLTISHESGLVLETTPGRLAAFRRAGATFEMSFGAFKIDETPESDWLEATHFGGFDDGKVVLLDAGDEEIGDLELSERGENLVLGIRARDGEMTRAALRFACDREGAFLGFGAQTHDVDHRGQKVPIWVSEQGIGKNDDDILPVVWPLVGTRHSSYLPIPGFIAPRAGAGWGLYSTTFRRSIWDVCKTNPEILEIENWDGGVEVLISGGPAPLDVIRQQTEFTGRPTLGPDWTFGVWMERIGGQRAVEEEAALLRRENIPASAMWTEDWRGGSREGRSYILDEDWRLDRDLYPDAEEMIAGLHSRGLKFMVYFNTFVTQGVDVFESLLQGGHLVNDRRGEPILFEGVKFEPSGLADLYREETRAFIKAEMEAAIALGADGWMADFGEWYPADPREVAPSNGLDPQEAHQKYPLEWAKLNREVIGDRDLVVFLRSGYTGSQGLAPVVWAGDQRTSFQADDGLPTVIPILLGLSASGFPIVTHDIGGYISATNPPADKELFLRWTALGALGPVMRTHHGRDADVNWRWSSDRETIEIFRRWADLHTRWFPIWKGLAREAAATGAPILRPIAFADPADPRLFGLKDQYLIGDSILVAPVVTASVTTRPVVLPKGDWRALEGPGEFSGPAEPSLPCPLGEAIILVKTGAILPLLPPGVQTLASSTSALDLDDVRLRREVRVWLGANGTFPEAEGGSYRLESPAKAVAPLTLTSRGEARAGDRSLRVTAAAETIVLKDAAGVEHVFHAVDVPANMQLEVEFIW